MKPLQDLIYIDFLNIIDDELLEEFILENNYIIKYIKVPSEKVQLASIKGHPLALEMINTPTKLVQLESIKKLNTFIFFMKYCYLKIDYDLALNLLYKKVPKQYKEIIKSHPNYKTDAQLVLEIIK